jgi:hypothetical protein
MKSIIIYFDEYGKNKQIIRPTETFWKQPDVLGLVQHVTSSFGLHDEYYRKYHHFEIK